MPSLPWFVFGVMKRNYRISPEDRCPIGNRKFSAAERARPRPHRSRPFVLLCMQVMRRGVSAELPFVLSSHGSLHRGVLLPLTDFPGKFFWTQFWMRAVSSSFLAFDTLLLSHRSPLPAIRGLTGRGISSGGSGGEPGGVGEMLDE